MGKKKMHRAFLWGKKKENAHLKKLRVEENVIFKCIFKNKTAKCGLDSCLSVLFHTGISNFQVASVTPSLQSALNRCSARPLTESDDTRRCKYNFDLLKMSIVLLETCRGI
jgi:hypothetical protein